MQPCPTIANKLNTPSYEPNLVDSSSKNVCRAQEDNSNAMVHVDGYCTEISKSSNNYSNIAEDEHQSVTSDCGIEEETSKVKNKHQSVARSDWGAE